MTAPIVIFTYNRVEHTKALVESLKKNDLINESEVFIFSDGYKSEEDKDKVQGLREYLRQLDKEHNFKALQIIYSEKNKGLATSVISGVSKIIKKYGKVIVLEDDLVLEKGFLRFMNSCLNYYETEKDIWSVSGFTSDIEYIQQLPEDVFFSCRARSWSWATWLDRWETVDWEVKSYQKFKWNLKKRREFNRGGADMAAMLDRQQVGVINSWAIRWCYNQFEQKKYNVQPTKSLVRNIGQDGSGTNCNEIKEKNVDLSDKTEFKLIPFKYDPQADYYLASRKKVPLLKLIVSYVIYVILKIKV